MRERLAISGLVGASLMAFGCSGASERPLNIDDALIVVSEVDAGRDAEGTAVSDECMPDTTRNCLIDLGVHAGIHDCVAGTQFCESSLRWSRCFPN